jgi:iron complex outermembrane receptor protein
MAQDDPTLADEEAIEEIVTTGSRIRKDTFTSAAPMDVILTEAAAARGINDVASLLQTTTVAAGAPQITAAISAAGANDLGRPASGGLGTSTISLRGLGANRTLVLLNGRRAGPSGVGGSVSSFDLNALPLAAVERIEVLKDGASSIYGSDAVAGVINIITKKTDGATFDAFIAQPDESGGEQTRFSGSWGKEFDRGYFRATADYNKTEILQRRDRDFFNCEEDYTFDIATGERADHIDPRTGAFLCDDLPWGHVWVYDYAEAVDEITGLPLHGDGTTNVGPPTYLLQYDFDGLLSANGLPGIAPATNPNHMTAPAGWFPIRQGDPLSDSLYDSQHPFHNLQTLVPKAEITTVFLEGEYELTDKVTAYSEFLINRRETENLGYLQIWSYIYNYDSADWGGFDGLGVSDPLSAGWTGAQWLSPLSITDQFNQRVTVDYSRVVLGLKGETESFLAGWDWDLSFQFSDSDAEYEDDIVLNDALTFGFFQTSSCVGETTAISGRACVDIPWLDPNFLAGDIPQDIQNFLYDTDTGTTKYEQWSTEGFMTGDLFEMPAGTAALAIGFHYREDELRDAPGPIISAGNAWQFGTGGVTTGQSDTSAIFAEIDVPLLADRPMVHYLDFNASVRYTDVSATNGLISYDADDTTYKVGMNWAITETFRLRSTFGTSFRTPALFELFLSNESSFLSARAADPCIEWGTSTTITPNVAANCAADGLPPDHVASVGPEVLTGGGADVLQPETSESFTFGMVWRPEFADLSVSVDYFDILVEDEIDKIGGAQIVAGCYESLFFPNEPLCDQFDRDLPTAPLPNAILEIRDSFINVAKQQARGVDIAANFNQDLGGGWGTLTVNTQWTLNIEDTVALFDATEEDLSGLAGHPDTVGNTNFTLQKGDWSIAWGVNYIGDTDNTARFRLRTSQTGPLTTVTDSSGTVVLADLTADSVVYHSLSASYAFDNGLTALLGVANVTDEAPPRMTAEDTSNEVDIVGQSAFYSQYDWLGRRVFLNVKMEF